MQSRQDWNGEDIARPLHSAGPSAYLCPEPEPEQVRADLVVIGGVFENNSPQVRLAKDQHPVQALSTHGANQTRPNHSISARAQRNQFAGRKARDLIDNCNPGVSAKNSYF
jgi:hypothetical protein